MHLERKSRLRKQHYSYACYLHCKSTFQSNGTVQCVERSSSTCFSIETLRITVPVVTIPIMELSCTTGKRFILCLLRIAKASSIDLSASIVKIGVLIISLSVTLNGPRF